MVMATFTEITVTVLSFTKFQNTNFGFYNFELFDFEVLNFTLEIPWGYFARIKKVPSQESNTSGHISLAL